MPGRIVGEQANGALAASDPESFRFRTRIPREAIGPLKNNLLAAA